MEIREEAWKKFRVMINSSALAETLRGRIEALLSPSEIVMLEKRLSILVLLERKTTYREIETLVDVTSATISFVKRHFVKKPTEHRRYSPYQKEAYPTPIRSSKRVAARLLQGK